MLAQENNLKSNLNVVITQKIKQEKINKKQSKEVAINRDLLDCKNEIKMVISQDILDCKKLTVHRKLEIKLC